MGGRTHVRDGAVPGGPGAEASTPVLYPDSSVHIMATLVFINRVLQNKHQAVSQGVRRFGKRSIF
jgi:hypothetical protein